MFSHHGRVWQYSEPERVQARVDEQIPGIEVRGGLVFRNPVIEDDVIVP
jgi:hypothetical protein